MAERQARESIKSQMREQREERARQLAVKQRAQQVKALRRQQERNGEMQRHGTPYIPCMHGISLLFRYFSYSGTFLLYGIRNQAMTWPVRLHVAGAARALCQQACGQNMCCSGCILVWESLHAIAGDMGGPTQDTSQLRVAASSPGECAVLPTMQAWSTCRQ